MSPKPLKANLKQEERGMALIMLVFVFALAGVAGLLSFLDGSFKLNAERRTALALSEAKQALIGWSAMQTNPGQLPCPEDTLLVGSANEGAAKSSCNTLPAIGRLPWRTLGVGDLRDGNGDKLWYVISSGFRSSPINYTSQAQLTVDGQANSAVAIIFSPGISLVSQNRNSTNLTNVSQYLELSNASGGNAFVTAGENFNDQLKVVTKEDLFKVINFRVLAEVRGDSSQGLNYYYASKNSYPFADRDGDGFADNNVINGRISYQGLASNSLYFSTAKKTMLTANGWVSLIGYKKLSTSQVYLELGNQSLTVAP